MVVQSLNVRFQGGAPCDFDGWGHATLALRKAFGRAIGRLMERESLMAMRRCDAWVETHATRFTTTLYAIGLG